MDTEYNLEKDNDWAKIASGRHLHISLAASGLRGYYCIGCSKEMVAVKPQKYIHHKAYFRHHATDVNRDTAECTFSSTDYRERLAGQMFARLKEINLPPVYKYPPAYAEGIPNLLAEATRLHATSVQLNISFYEDEQGVVRWGKDVPDEGSYFLYKTNVVFFNDGKPALLLEFVVSHKVTDEKKSILRKLGINTVQIIVPKSSEEEIEKKLKSANKVKWIYNETESNTPYIPVQPGDSKRIPDIDYEQRKLFEESLACRASQISNLVRSIRRCVSSQPYRNVERNLALEIERIESLRDAARARLDEMESSYQREAYAEIEPEEIEIEQRLIELGQKEDGTIL